MISNLILIFSLTGQLTVPPAEPPKPMDSTRDPLATTQAKNSKFSYQYCGIQSYLDSSQMICLLEDDDNHYQLGLGVLANPLLLLPAKVTGDIFFTVEAVDKMGHPHRLSVIEKHGFGLQGFYRADKNDDQAKEPFAMFNMKTEEVFPSQ